MDESGRFSIRLNPGVVLSYADQRAGGLKVFLQPRGYVPSQRQASPPGSRETGDDDVPW